MKSRIDVCPLVVFERWESLEDWWRGYGLTFLIWLGSTYWGRVEAVASFEALVVCVLEALVAALL